MDLSTLEKFDSKGMHKVYDMCPQITRESFESDQNQVNFDVVTDTNDIEKATSFAKEWLKSIGEESSTITANECKFCHTQSVPEDMEIEIMTDGYSISKMEGCPN